MASGIELAGDNQVSSREALVNQWTADGRVFIAHNPVVGQPETMSATGTAIGLTAPSIRYTIPSGALVVPIHVKLAVLTVGAKDDIFGVLVSEGDSYTSGGDAVAAVTGNAVVQGDAGALRSPGVTNLHYSDTAIVEAALTNVRLLKIEESQPPATNQSWNPEYNILKGDPMVYIVGPASFLVYAVQETAAAEAEFSLSWAELDMDLFTN